MSTWVVDASCAAEILLRTDLGERARATIQNGDALAPDLLDAEVLSVIRKLHLVGRISLQRAQEALTDLLAWKLERVPNALLVNEAWRYRQNLTAYDALYVAAARTAGATVVTADGPLARAPGLDVPVYNLRV